jgi:hypothetical protein
MPVRTDEGQEAVYKVTYDEAVRALDHQADVLESLRTRAATLFAAANVATAFLAGVALKDQEFVLESTIAAVCYFGVLAITVYVLAPKDWTFELNSRDLIRDFPEAERPYPLSEMYRDLALFMRDHYESNKKEIDRLFGFLLISIVLLGAEIIAWTVDLGLGVQHGFI